MDIDSLTYGQPSKEDKDLMSRDLKFLPDIESPERMILMPFSNSSVQTEDELLSISFLPEELSDNDIRVIDEEDENFITNTFFRYLDNNNIDYNVDDVEETALDVASLVMKAKYRFNRPRPNQLAEYHSIDINPRAGKSADSPSYPSGHSAQATFLARMLGDQNPKHKVKLMELGESVGINRLKGNFHYPSDHEAGVEFGKDLYDLYKANKASDIKVNKEKQTKYI